MHRLPRHRPKLERLEARLPPGDALLGVLLAWPTIREATVIEPASVLAGTSLLIDDLAALSIDADLEFNQRFISKSSSIVPAASATTIDSGSDTRAHSLSQSPHIGAYGGSHGRSDFVVSTSWITAPVATATNAWRPPATLGTRTSAAIAPSGLTPKTDVDEVHKAKAVQNYGQLPLSFEANHGQTDSRVDFIAKTGGATVFLTPTVAVFVMQNSEFGNQNSETIEPSSAVEASTGVASRAALAAGLPHDSQSPTRTLTRHGSPGVALHMQIVGANPEARAAGVNSLPGIVNYFIGNDPSLWHANIPTFGRVEYHDVYPGIDLAYYGGQSGDGNGAGLEYDFIVSPGADPSAITLNFAGADRVEINPHGDLVLHTAVGDVVQQKPFTYQEVNGLRQEVTSEYALDGTQVSFAVGDYESTRPLVIDPLVLGYSTYLGGNLTDDSGYGIAVGGGNAFLNGSTTTSEFPATPGAFDTTFNGGASDSFVAKLNADGSALAYSTYLGGSSDDRGQGIAVDGAGNAYVTGRTSSTDFPTTPGAFDPTYNGGVSDPFVVKLSADGSALAYGTYLGGSSTDDGEAITVDGAGSAYATGYTESSDFPTTLGTFDSTDNGARDAFVVKLSADGSTLAYGGYLGGADTEDGEAIAVDAGGNAYVTGYTGSTDFPTTPGAFDTTYNDAFSDPYVVKLSADGATLTYGTYLGSGIGYGIAVDGAGNVYITGRANSTDFPTTPGAFDTTHNGGNDAFAAKLNAGGSTLGYATYLGGSNDERGFSIAVNLAGNAYVTGFTVATDFPTTPGAFDITFNGSRDAFVAKLGADGSSLVYGTYLGGTDTDYGNGIAVDGAGNAYVTGYTASSNFPTTPVAYDPTFSAPTDAFVTKFCERACRVPANAEPVQVVP